MRFEWRPWNIKHVIERHVSKDLAESVYLALDQNRLVKSKDGLAYSGVSIVGGQRYFITFMRTQHQAEVHVFIVTGYGPLRKSQKAHL